MVTALTDRVRAGWQRRMLAQCSIPALGTGALAAAMFGIALAAAASNTVTAANCFKRGGCTEGPGIPPWPDIPPRPPGNPESSDTDKLAETVARFTYSNLMSLGMSQKIEVAIILPICAPKCECKCEVKGEKEKGKEKGKPTKQA